MDDFMNALAGTMVHSRENMGRTENGALGHKSTGRKLLDMNFAVSSMRRWSDEDILHKFIEVIGDAGIDTAVTWLFFARDVRGGMGERRLFRVCMSYVAREFPMKAKAVLPLIAEYGRWDDVVELAFSACPSQVSDAAKKLIVEQMKADIAAYKKGESISLLAKWMPSINTSSRVTVDRAMQLASYMGLSRKNYQRLLSKMRGYLKVVERDMSAGNWSEINYEHVPSRANLNYNNAFLRHDEQRRRQYLGKLKKGEAKINAGAVFPHDIVHKYHICHGWSGYTSRVNIQPDLEAMWKALPNTVPENDSTIVVADGSGSMNNQVGHSSVTAVEVADALAVYFAEKLKGAYKDKYIVFSSRPQLVNLGGATTLKGKLEIVARNTDCSNTNIARVFDLILETAVRNRMKQHDLPRNVLIISDMEFDGACGHPNRTLFDNIKGEFAFHGYKMPRLVFWNVNSRTGVIPVIENDLGVALVSGFSPSVAKMVMSNATDPLEALMETLQGERYKPVREALAGVK